MPFLPILSIPCPGCRLWAAVPAGVQAAGRGAARGAGRVLHIGSALHGPDSPAVLAGTAVILILYSIADRDRCAGEHAGEHGPG